MATRPRTPPTTDVSPDTPSDSPSPSSAVPVADRIVSPEVARRRGPGVRARVIRIMRDVLFVGKDQTNTEGGRYNFRGIDDVTRALGPALRNHGVIMLPEVIDAERRDAKTTRGKDTRETILRVRFTFTDEDGDSLVIVTEGESLDSGDKGTAKAMSVAWRTAMIIAFALPTDEPDPDSFSWDRGDEREDRRDRRGRRDNGREDRPRERGRDEDRHRTTPDRVNAEDIGDERDDLIDTADPDEARNRALLSLKDKIRHYRLDKGATADVFVDLFGEELPTADADLIDKFTGVIVAIGGLPRIDAEPTEQHPLVARLIAVREAVDQDNAHKAGNVRSIGPNTGPGAGDGDDNP